MKTIRFWITLMLIMPHVLRSQTNEWVSEPLWGYEFQIPDNWVLEKDYTGALLAHENIEGVILVIPTKASDFAEVRTQMLEGLAEEGTYLSLTGNLQYPDEMMIAGYYSGYYEYQEVSAYIIATHYQGGSGAYVLALGSSYEFNNALETASKAIATSIRLTDHEKKTVETHVNELASLVHAELMGYFAGTYYSYTSAGFVTGGTERRLAICANGKFYYSSESGYSGGSGTGGGWGAANQSGNAGEWIIDGTKETGVVELHYSNGKKEVLNYKVCGDGCIYFGQIKYAYEKAAVCD